MQRAYRFALVCGIVPMFAGMAIFLLWLLTRSDSLMIAGAMGIYLAVAVVLLGFTALGWYVWMGLRTPNVSRKSLWSSTLKPAALLISNLPVAVALGSAALYFDHSFRVTVHNESAQPLIEVRVIGGGSEISFGTVPEGGTTTSRRLPIKESGTLEFRGTSGAATLRQTIESELKPGKAGHLIITVSPDGTISARYEQRA